MLGSVSTCPESWLILLQGWQSSAGVAQSLLKGGSDGSEKMQNLHGSFQARHSWVCVRTKSKRAAVKWFDIDKKGIGILAAFLIWLREKNFAHWLYTAYRKNLKTYCFQPTFVPSDYTQRVDYLRKNFLIMQQHLGYRHPKNFRVLGNKIPQLVERESTAVFENSKDPQNFEVDPTHYSTLIHLNPSINPTNLP